VTTREIEGHLKERTPPGNVGSEVSPSVSNVTEAVLEEVRTRLMAVTKHAGCGADVAVFSFQAPWRRVAHREPAP
jgi:hypothetical protein